MRPLHQIGDACRGRQITEIGPAHRAIESVLATRDTLGNLRGGECRVNNDSVRNLRLVFLVLLLRHVLLLC